MPALLTLALLMIITGGYQSGAWQQLFSKKGLDNSAAAEQRAIDHMFGSDQIFDPNADNVTDTAKSDHDSVSWKMLAHAQVKNSGQRSMHIDYAKDVAALDGKTITITGYMFPLQNSDDQSHFLLSAYPPSCPYCLPAGPAELIEINDCAALRFTYEPIALEGKMQLLQKGEDLKDGMFYRMSKAHLVKPQTK